VAGRQPEPAALPARGVSHSGSRADPPDRAVGARRLLRLEQQRRTGRLLAAGAGLPPLTPRPPEPGRGSLDLRALGCVLPGPPRRTAGPGLVPAGRLPAERSALRRPDRRLLPGLAAIARRPLRAAARHEARLQLGDRGQAASLRPVGSRRRRTDQPLDVL